MSKILAFFLNRTKKFLTDQRLLNKHYKNKYKNNAHTNELKLKLEIEKNHHKFN